MFYVILFIILFVSFFDYYMDIPSLTTKWILIKVVYGIAGFIVGIIGNEIYARFILYKGK